VEARIFTPKPKSCGETSMPFGALVETTRWIHFYPRRGKFSALVGHPMAHGSGTRCRVIGKGTETDRFLVKACDIESGYLAWVSPEDVTILN
jgi:hypothetical protein